MPARSVDQERQTGPGLAIQIARRAAERVGLRIDTDELAAKRIGASRVVSARISEGSTVVESGTGKGLGQQADASAIFEAFEHAASRRLLPGQSLSETDSGDLVEQPWEWRDLQYRFARRRSNVPTLAFRMLGDEAEVIRYPRIAVDMSYKASEFDGDLLFLDRACTTGGYAAGTSTSDAAIHAVNELIERDAISELLLSDYVPSGTAIEIAGDLPPHLELLRRELERDSGDFVQLVRIPSCAGWVTVATLGSGSDLMMGAGCSARAAVAIERCLTELHQEVVATSLGITMEDEGGDPLTQLSRYPALLVLAQGRRPRPTRSLSYSQAVVSSSAADINLAPLLRSQGFPVLIRRVWSSREETSDDDAAVEVVQAVIPGLEHFTDLLLGRAVVPTGRLSSPSLTRTLTRTEEA